ncbi:MAG: glutaredoxin family protein [Massilia sp.]
MKRNVIAVAAGLGLLLCAGGASAQMYKWTDAKGVVHFGDSPPPADAKKTQEVRAAGGPGGGAPLPYALAQAARNSPVTLYTMTDCDSCKLGRQLLQKRGIPFSEKTVSSNEDLAKLKAITNEATLPQMTVGGRKLVGFEEFLWNQALSDAEYPATAMLPAGYRQAQPEQLAPIKAAAPERPLVRQAAPPPPPPPKNDNAPPGFQF